MELKFVKLMEDFKFNVNIIKFESEVTTRNAKPYQQETLKFWEGTVVSVGFSKLDQTKTVAPFPTDQIMGDSLEMEGESAIGRGPRLSFVGSLMGCCSWWEIWIVTAMVEIKWRIRRKIVVEDDVHALVLFFLINKIDWGSQLSWEMEKEEIKTREMMKFKRYILVS